MFDELSTVSVCGNSVNCAEMSNRLFVDVSKNFYGPILFERGKMQSKRTRLCNLQLGCLFDWSKDRVTHRLIRQ